MPTTSYQLRLSARPDRKLAWDGGGSVRYIVADVHVPEAPAKEPAERLPLNLALVIDASGSMSGGPLEAAKEAAVGVAARLEAKDTLSIVSFAEDVVTHLDGVPMDEAGRKFATTSLHSLETRGTTNLSGGWFQGAQCVATVMEGRSGLHNRVILLSDGHANRGILDPDKIGEHAEKLLARGLATSTVGIGDGYNPEYLRALAQNGGGTMHDAEHAHEIIEVLMAELGDVRNLAAEDLRVAIRTPDGVRAMAVQSGAPTWSGEAIMRFGAVIAKSTKRAVFRVKMPRGTAGDEAGFVIEARWKAPGEKYDRIATAEVALTYATGVVNTPQPRDLATTAAAGEAWHSAVLMHASRLNRARQWAEAGRFLEQELRFFRIYADGVPALMALVVELEAIQREAGRDWGERSRKEVEMLSYRSMLQKTESRSSPRAASASRLIQANPPRRQSYDYPLEFDGDHWFVEVDGRRMLLGTGSPASVGAGAFTFAGQSRALTTALDGVSLADLVRLVGVPFDGLLGMDVLAGKRVTFDGKRGLMRVHSQPSPGLPSVPCSTTMGIPAVAVHIGGSERKAFLDLGARVSYVAGGVSGPTEEVEDFYPGIGRFSTQAGLSEVRVAGLPFQLRMGALPRQLETTLMVAGCDAILGAELLKHVVLHFDFLAGLLRIES